MLQKARFLVFFAFFVFTQLPQTQAGVVTEGSPCSPANDHVDASSRRWLSDCDDRTFCAIGSGTSSSASGNDTSPNDVASEAPFSLTASASATASGTVLDRRVATKEGGKAPTSVAKDIATSTTIEDLSLSNPSELASTTAGTSSPSPSMASNQTGICTRRRCRTAEFPFGFAPGEVLPAVCDPQTSFCPDSGEGCLPLRKPGDTCDLDRDYQCAPPSFLSPASNSSNVNYDFKFSFASMSQNGSMTTATGSVCLGGMCYYANATLGLQCVREYTTYTGYNRGSPSNTGSGDAYNVSVSRDNCLQTWPYLYCESELGVCMSMKELGSQCEDDAECRSEYCHAGSGVCSDPPGLPVKVQPWQYGVTVTSVLLAIALTCMLLALSHKRQRMERYYELLEYYHEQTSLRASIISLHTAAARRASMKE